MTFRISSANQVQWEQAIVAAEATHLYDLAVMDILGAKSLCDLTVLDIGAGRADSGLTPVTAEAEKWIDLALSLEEMQ